MKLRIAILSCGLAVMNAFATDMTVPRQSVAGSKVSVQTSGTGDAVAVLVAPGHIVAKPIVLGKPFDLSGDDLADAGQYTLILTTSSGEISKSFVIVPSSPAHLSFVAHPSRAPVAQKGRITGTAYIFDAYNNLVPRSVTVDFKLSGTQTGTVERRVFSSNGVAAVSMDSPAREGPFAFQATSGAVQSTRRIRVVADEPCTLQIHAAAVNTGLVRVRTDPVKDCSGNLVPDGTLVTFTQWDAKGRSTIETSIKKGIAQADLPAKGEIRISAASGVALGKEIRLRAMP